MNVTPAQGRFPAPPAIEPAQNSREQTDQGESFEEVLAATLRSQVALEPSVVEAEAVPSVAKAEIAELQLALTEGYRPAPAEGTPAMIGEDAVRFDARPVVGRSFIPEAGVEQRSFEPAQPLELIAASAEDAPFGRELQRAFARSVHRIGGMEPGPVILTAAGPGPLRPPAGSGPTVPALPDAASRADRTLAPRDSRAPAATSRNGRAEQRTNISLTLFAHEVLVTVRGMRLTADEEERLGSEMRGLLASFDLGGRTLRVVNARRN